MEVHFTSEGVDVQHFTPDAWIVALEATQDVPAPKPENKAAAHCLVTTEVLQYGMGWLLLTQMGVLLGSFGQLLPLGVSLLSFAIFMLEAMLKFLRSWAHRSFFMGVPCAYVGIHEATVDDTLRKFETSLFVCLGLELGLYIPYIFVVIRFLVETQMCSNIDHHDYCGSSGSTTTVYLSLLCSISVVLHGLLSLVTFWAFHSAMGTGLTPSVGRKEGKGWMTFERLVWRLGMKKNWNRIQHFCGARRGDMDRIQCLTWWVHSARHRHLSAVVARAQAENCGLPGHWFESVEKLKKTVKDCVMTGGCDHVLNLVGPDVVSLEMGLRALVSLAKQGDEEICRQILSDKGFDLLIEIASEGKFSTCRGLAAAAIGILVTKRDAISKANLDVSAAVVPLKRLARAKEHELKEVALGALLNLFLASETFQEVLAQFRSSDGFVEGFEDRFLRTLMDLARSGPTTRCQELAMGILTRLAGDCEEVREMLVGDEQHYGEIPFLIELLQDGQTPEIMVSAAGVLAEVAIKDGKKICRGPHGSSCIAALIQAMRGDYRIAKAATKALSNLAIKDNDSKHTIVHAGGVKMLVDLLCTTLANKTALETDEVQAEAARALWILSFKSPARQKLIMVENAIPALAKLLQTKTNSVLIQALAALTGLAWANQQSQDLIREDESNVFSRVVQILDELVFENLDKKIEERVLEKIALAIVSFIQNNRTSQERLLSEGARGKLELILQKSSDKYKETATKRVEHAVKLLSNVEASL